MAADYAEDAVLVRGERRYEGRSAIRAYFASLPSRLGDGVVTFPHVQTDGERVTFRWRVAGGPAHGAAGTDVCMVSDGLIVEQRVHQDGDRLA